MWRIVDGILSRNKEQGKREEYGRGKHKGRQGDREGWGLRDNKLAPRVDDDGTCGDGPSAVDNSSASQDDFCPCGGQHCSEMVLNLIRIGGVRESSRDTHRFRRIQYTSFTYHFYVSIDCISIAYLSEDRSMAYAWCVMSVVLTGEVTRSEHLQTVYIIVGTFDDVLPG